MSILRLYFCKFDIFPKVIIDLLSLYESKEYLWDFEQSDKRLHISRNAKTVTCPRWESRSSYETLQLYQYGAIVKFPIRQSDQNLTLKLAFLNRFNRDFDNHHPGRVLIGIINPFYIKHRFTNEGWSFAVSPERFGFSPTVKLSFHGNTKISATIQDSEKSNIVLHEKKFNDIGYLGCPLTDCYVCIGMETKVTVTLM